MVGSLIYSLVQLLLDVLVTSHSDQAELQAEVLALRPQIEESRAGLDVGRGADRCGRALLDYLAGDRSRNRAARSGCCRAVIDPARGGTPLGRTTHETSRQWTRRRGTAGAQNPGTRRI